MTAPLTPRTLDPAQTFAAIVDWIEEKSRAQHAPGLIVGISGTDSILTFLACARAFEKIGRPEAVLGVHYAHQTPRTQKGAARLRDEFNVVTREIWPWLQAQAPAATLEMNHDIPVHDDNVRWGHLFSRAVRDTTKGQALTHRFYFPVGTRNATEDHLGTYSQASKAVSMLPLVDIFKSEVLDICAHLGVPAAAIAQSRAIDCDCGRYDVQADHMRELDLLIMTRMGLLDKKYLTTLPKDTLQKISAFYVHERAANEFRHRTPYRPDHPLIITRDPAP